MEIRVDDIHYTYPGGVKALDGVSLTIQPGEALALVGENGSGKTTLARHLNGLLRPQSGSVWIGDWRTDQRRPAQLASRVGYVFQNPDEQLFRRRVWDEVAFGPQNLGFPPGRVRQAAAQALETLGLDPFAQLNPRDLGYSVRKQVALASVPAMQTPVLVLDEPTAGLDAGEQRRIGALIRALQAGGRTVLTISHDMDFIAETFERVVLIWQGQIRLDAPTRRFFEHGTLLDQSGLIQPQLVRLDQRLRRANPPLTIE
ncbi:MAG: energy-coupling factor ABC transporter ATP-binding protein [Chloroflexota bacterium]